MGEEEGQEVIEETKQVGKVVFESRYKISPECQQSENEAMPFIAAEYIIERIWKRFEAKSMIDCEILPRATDHCIDLCAFTPMYILDKGVPT